MSNTTMGNKLKKKGLSPRQVGVVTLVCKGMTNKAIGKDLYVTEKCIKYHMTNIFKLTKTANRTDLAVWATGL